MNAAYALRAFHVSPQDSQEPGFDAKSGIFSVTACPAVSTGKPRRMHRGTRNPRKENLMFVKPVFGSLVAAFGSDHLASPLAEQAFHGISRRRFIIIIIVRETARHDNMRMLIVNARTKLWPLDKV
jgi:hypothetical protein